MFRLLLNCVFISLALGATLIFPDDGKIIGGQEANIKDFPHQISMRFIDPETMDFYHVCGGSILNSKTVVTAAHCTDGKTVSFLRVKVGTNLRDDDSKLYEVEKLIQHEDFDIKTYNNDIAILKLKEALTWSDKVQPINLNDAELAAGTEVVVSGWGLTQEGSHDKPDKLRKVKVNVVPFKECQSDYKGQLTKTMMCANANGKDACQGDSGGPLILASPRKLVGVVSWGEGCGHIEHPGIYTNVANMLPWIRKYL